MKKFWKNFWIFFKLEKNWKKRNLLRKIIRKIIRNKKMAQWIWRSYWTSNSAKKLKEKCLNWWVRVYKARLVGSARCKTHEQRSRHVQINQSSWVPWAKQKSKQCKRKKPGYSTCSVGASTLSSTELTVLVVVVVVLVVVVVVQGVVVRDVGLDFTATPPLRLRETGRIRSVVDAGVAVVVVAVVVVVVASVVGGNEVVLRDSSGNNPKSSGMEKSEKFVVVSSSSSSSAGVVSVYSSSSSV